ncbi:23S rRNA (uracil(1939)-C(5))-methyltransferase RlmD [Aliivibrio sp. S4TY2]|uniref:23S rRNA (uracil(1939)-C(5))-methyltransferase RlmD n=1 Tax=unclassified Aliivibrio TaxID=2645654 RepID=UPI002378CCAF|nr:MULTISPECIES: 23S rRNA (uracil(1939)-C(5))-methyltransferase RlmD [unclassified Aliivibrio]MDD9155020.1 23S rRNA (uracil(1939)-C(5))-methyltransferase RlmD [Aliivibrio sp. S4TY2]MDD9158617.1 23S rRNA (uracil(1939)-C(5))-methyltransferase RlmD [Aliivibrio sp. S4TY1]MDD9163023.1 23S rRNA (uracil(1939)-C(5))-methyltransferase RlmD [Aliivibrio sp. S4MY2]MDD9166616.1 23S rRNA (uracil(1939)-C(5))-methyltransferase RlmD [Aliivibrio sp. S4MY4]MDD9184100.1 23S rRNA (uracil(1939)-C(5))-methyltransfer
MAQFFKAKKKASVNTKHHSVDVVRLDHNGAGIAFVDKKPVFIDGALPEEKAIIQFTEQKKQYARARLIKVIQKSTKRQAPICQHYHECGGCNLQHLQHQEQIAAKNQKLQELMQKQGVEHCEVVAPISDNEQGYRRRARISLMVNKQTNQLDFGFRKKQSKAIVNVRHCPVLVQELDQHLESLHALLNQLKGKKHLGHVELVQADNGSVLLIRHVAEFNEKDHQSLVNYCEERNLILYLMPESDVLTHVCGEEPYYVIDGAKIYFTPKDFIQVNRHVNNKMVEQALSWLNLKETDSVLDLFCGLGNFSLPLAQKVKNVVGIEGVDEMVQRAQSNAKRNALDNVTFYQANLEEDITDQVWASTKFTKILLDPARAGAAGVMETVAKLTPQTVVYVSCNPATLARDSQLLIQHGYKLTRLGMLDMFPHTGHLESMALFER